MIVAGGRVRKALRASGDRPILTDSEGRTRTGDTLAGRVERLAGALASRGLARSRIGLWYQNGLAAFEAFLAVEYLGGARVPVDPGVPESEARAVFAAAQVDVVLADAGHAEDLGGDVLIHDDDAPLTGRPWQEEVTLPPGAPLMIYPRAVPGGRLFGVTMSYQNWDSIMQVNRFLFKTGWYGQPFDDQEMFLTVQQLMHGTGMVGSFPFLLMGRPQVVLPRFDADAMLDAILRHRVTATFAVPGMLTRLANVVEARGDRTRLPLRHTLYGGAPTDIAEIRRLIRVLGPSLVQLYGRFEAGWPLSVLGHADHDNITAGDDDIATSCGLPIPNIEIRLRRVAGLADTQGELQTRSSMASEDYIDPDGWCSLGDIATIDARGYLHLAGRLDRMINTGSYHVYPEEVEEAIAKLAGVHSVRVTGEPDPVWGQAVTAFVVTDLPENELVDEVRAQLGTRLAKYKIPKVIKVVDHLS